MGIGLTELVLVAAIIVIALPLVVVGGVFWFLLNKRKRIEQKPGD